VVASGVDLSVLNYDDKSIAAKASEFGQTSAAEVMSQTVQGHYNDVVVLGDEKCPNGISVIGFLANVDTHGNYIDPPKAAIMVEHHRRFGLPLVKNVKAPKYPENKVKKTKNHISVDLNGFRYKLSGFKENFIRLGDVKGREIMTTGEMVEVKKFLLDNKLKEEIIEDIEQHFNKIDRDSLAKKLKMNESHKDELGFEWFPVMRNDISKTLITDANAQEISAQRYSALA
jgi:hypothetical protein